MSDRPARREVLRTAPLAVAAVSTTAGCLGSLGGEATDTAGGDDDAPAFTARNWLVAPDALADREHYRFGVAEPATLADSDYAGTFAPVVPDGPLAEATGVEGTRVETFVRYDAVQAWELDVDADAVAESLSAAGYAKTGTHEGYELYAGQGRAVGVGDGAIGFGVQVAERDAEAMLTAAIDASTGRADRYAAERDALATLLDAAGDVPFLWAGTRDPPAETRPADGRFAGNRGLGIGLEVEGGLTMEILLTFDDGDAAKPGPVETWVDQERSPVFATMENPTVEASGRLVTVTGSPDASAVERVGIPDFFDVEPTTRRTAMGTSTAAVIEAGATVSVDDPGDAVTVTWASSRTAEHLTVAFRPRNGERVEKRIDEVGGTATYEGTDGKKVAVVVRGHRNGRSAVVLRRVVEL